MDISTLAAIAAGLGVIGVMRWATFTRREEDAFELSNAELLELTSGSDHWPPDDPAGGRVHYQPIPSEGAPALFIGSDPSLPGGPITGGAAVLPPGGPVLCLIDACGVSAPVVRSRWPRPSLFRVK